MTQPTIPRVSFQGEPGAFSEMAIAQHWPGGAQSVSSETFDEVAHKLTARAVDFAVLPLKNAIAGEVHRSIAALEKVRKRTEIVTTVTVPVQLALMAPADATLDTIRTVLSHPIALAQCGSFFAAHPQIRRQVHFDTAGAARDVAIAEDVTMAAIASEIAAVRYGLTVLAHSIQDRLDNWTQFAIVKLRDV